MTAALALPSPDGYPPEYFESIGSTARLFLARGIGSEAIIAHGLALGSDALVCTGVAMRSLLRGKPGRLRLRVIARG